MGKIIAKLLNIDLVVLGAVRQKVTINLLGNVKGHWMVARGKRMRAL